MNRIETTNDLMDFSNLVSTTVGLINKKKDKTALKSFQPSYFEDLDRLIGGFEIGKVSAIVGRPAMGKTMLAMNIVKNIAFRGTPVLVFSLSTSKEDWAKYLLCSSAKLDLHKVRIGALNENESVTLDQVAETNSSIPLYVVDHTRTFEEIKSFVEQAIKDKAIGLVLIDGISDFYGNVPQTIKSRAQRYERQLQALKEMAAQWNVPVLLTQNLSRRFERNPYSAVSKYEYGIKEGNLYQNVDRILHIYREEYYDPTEDNRGLMEVRVVPMKFCEPYCTVRLQFQRDFALVKEFEMKPFNPNE